MKNFRLTRNIKIIFATVLVIILGAVIVGSVTNNKVNGFSCTKAGCKSSQGFQQVPEMTDSSAHYYLCRDCNTIIPQSHSNVSKTRKLDATYHGWYYKCSICGYASADYEKGAHSYDSNGNCTMASYGCTATGTPGTGGGGTSGGGTEGGGSSGDYEYDWYSLTQHYYWSASGGGRYLENHTSSSWEDQGNGTHWALCSKCGGAASFSHTIVTVTGKNPTCTQTGLKEGERCTSCNYKKQETIPALGHDWKAATCTTPKTCSTCGATEGSALGHDWKAATCLEPKTCRTCNTTEGTTAGHDWKAATCTAPKTCRICNTTEGTTAGHDWKSATCTEPKTCRTCNTTEGSALGHDWKAATCTAPKTCRTCNTTEGSALGHDWKSATCTAPKTCRTCNTTQGSSLGHSFTNYVSNNDATCQSNGTKTAKCNRCSVTDTITDQGTMLSHNYQNGTCTYCGQKEQGDVIECSHSYTTKYNTSEHWQECSKCREEKANSREKHTKQTIPEVSPTCTESGLSTGSKCSKCLVIIEEQQVVPALGHSFTNYVSNNDATCDYDGTKTAICDRCSETETKIDEGSKLTHNYQNGTCINCGRKENVQDVEKLEITSQKYKIKTNYMLNVQPDTKVSDFKTNISTNATTIFIYNKNNIIVDDGEIVTTGMKILLIKEGQTKSFTIVVKGDANGDGEADFKDIVKINQARLNRITLEKIYTLAADVTEDGKADFKDLVKINRFRLKKIREI